MSGKGPKMIIITSVVNTHVYIEILDTFHHDEDIFQVDNLSWQWETLGEKVE